MKKNILIGIGALAVGAGIFIGLKRTQQENVGHASGLSSVDQNEMPVSSLPSAEQRQRAIDRATENLRGLTEEQTEASSPQLSEPVTALIGADGAPHNYPGLLAEINKLTYDITPNDVVALMDMLAYPNDQFPEGMRPIEINAVKNDVLDMLLHQTVLPEGIGLRMAEMAGDVNQDPVWRDYCVQFMGPFYEKKSQVERSRVEGLGAGGSQAPATEDSEATAAPNELDVIRGAMFQALEERDSTIAGTSLIGLENLSRTHDEFDREVIVSKATEIASDESATSTSRLTALRLAAGISNFEHDQEGISTDLISNVEVVDAARSLAQTGETVLLRSAAIVTLGEVGSANDRELIESYLLADNKQIASAARMALAKMDAR